MLAKVDKFLFPIDFTVMDMDEDNEVPLILSKPLMKISKVMIDVNDGKLTVRGQGDELQFNVFEANCSDVFLQNFHQSLFFLLREI